MTVRTASISPTLSLSSSAHERSVPCTLAVEQAFKIAQICFAKGPAGCVCTIMMMIKPAWIDGLKGSTAAKTALMKCKGGDVWDLLMKLVTDEILKWLSSGMNWFIRLINGLMYVARHTHTHIGGVTHLRESHGRRSGHEIIFSRRVTDVSFRLRPAMHSLRCVGRCTAPTTCIRVGTRSVPTSWRRALGVRLEVPAPDEPRRPSATLRGKSRFV